MYYLISEAAKKVHVETHVLRYWEEELEIPIKRNELGHRYYTADDIDRFVCIKDWKEQGLQLKAIRLLLEGDKLIPLDRASDKKQNQGAAQEMSDLVDQMTKEERLKKMAELMKQALVQTMREVNAEQTKVLLQNEEEHYRKLDTLMRDKQKQNHKWFGAKKKHLE